MGAGCDASTVPNRLCVSRIGKSTADSVVNVSGTVGKGHTCTVTRGSAACGGTQQAGLRRQQLTQMAPTERYSPTMAPHVVRVIAARRCARVDTSDRKQ